MIGRKVRLALKAQEINLFIGSVKYHIQNKFIDSDLSSERALRNVDIHLDAFCEDYYPDLNSIRIMVATECVFGANSAFTTSKLDITEFKKASPSDVADYFINELRKMFSSEKSNEGS